MKALLLFALGTILHPGVALRDIDGVMREPMKVAKGHAEALFFITNDCPVSNYYSREIHRICDDYAQRGVGCALVYTDATLTDDQARQHAKEYGHGSYPKMVDRTHTLVKATGAAVTPTAVVIRPDESIAYRGRIDNFYAALGKPRRVVTAHDLRDALDAVLAGKPVAKPETSPVGCYIQ
ncbi:MAG TPA: hypothetical protein VG297_08395 [Bryobacteraceae bacterium]|jgi:DNA-binding transcriptional LysR family regulator|nr:hypothetical protein [Bryobacteraceae bacterium]